MISLPIPVGVRRMNGPSLTLRLIQPEDADYVHRLRQDPRYNQYLSEVRGTAEDQRRWIDAYKTREASGIEFYYVIECQDGTPCGTVRLSEIKSESFTWGSWILDQNKPRMAALESALLSYCVAFDLIGAVQARFYARRDNARAIAFHRRFGATETHADAQDIFFVYPRTQFEADRAAHLATIKASAQP
jgi:RimJ/RimL family protein N-acetyltransferase